MNNNIENIKVLSVDKPFCVVKENMAEGGINQGQKEWRNKEKEREENRNKWDR